MECLQLSAVYAPADPDGSRIHCGLLHHYLCDEGNIVSFLNETISEVKVTMPVSLSGLDKEQHFRIYNSLGCEFNLTLF